MEGLQIWRIARPVGRDYRYLIIYMELSRFSPLCHDILLICRHFIANYCNFISFWLSDDITCSEIASLEVHPLLADNLLRDMWHHIRQPFTQVLQDVTQDTSKEVSRWPIGSATNCTDYRHVTSSAYTITIIGDRCICWNSRWHDLAEKIDPILLNWVDLWWILSFAISVSMSFTNYGKVLYQWRHMQGIENVRSWPIPFVSHIRTHI